MPGELSDFDAVMASIAAPLDFTITMSTDSTNETWVDINTGLDDGEALLVYGFEYDFESIDPTTPIDLHPNTFAGSWVCQLQRNDDAELLLNQHDSEVLLHHGFFTDLNTTGGYGATQRPFRRFQRTATISPILRAMFRTSIDNTEISLTSVQLTGRIFCDKFEAPSVGVTKLGHLANL